MLPAIRTLRDAAVFAPCYVALDWASFIDPAGPFNITPWNPQPALALIWMLLGGLQQLPAVLLTVFAAELLVRGAPLGYGVAVAGAIVLSGGYAGMAGLLRSILRNGTGLRSLRELTQFCVLAVAGSAAIGMAFVGIPVGAGLLPPEGFYDSWLRFLVSESVGILVTAPLLLAAANAARRRTMLAFAARAESVAQLAVLAATLWLVFSDALGEDPVRHFYLLFVPLIWIAARGRLNGAIAAAAVVQLGVVAGMQVQHVTAVPAIELQALVAAFTLTGLYLGMMVEERERAAESLRETLRLAVAGEMAGAIAHEVNQPLTALTNYGRSAQMMIGAAGGPGAELAEVIRRMLAEAQRAADVVRRLRDLFREGTTRLEPVRIEELIAAAERIGAQLIGQRPVALKLSAEPGLGVLYIDRLQIELVLRNLLANAVEAIGERRGSIAVAAQRRGLDQVCFVVADSGPGVAASMRTHLFEPFTSGKPSGMGLGLAISRAIAEAHGGALDIHADEHGEFHLILPCAPAGSV